MACITFTTRARSNFASKALSCAPTATPNAELMDKYGLPSDVYNLYKLSWHGVDVSVYKSRWPTIWHDSAVCTDCHGVHDILQTGDPQSQCQLRQPAGNLPEVPPRRERQLDRLMDWS